jgi:hypothetical protein
MDSFKSRYGEWQQDFEFVSPLDARVRQGTQNTQIQPTVSVEDQDVDWEDPAPDDDHDGEDLPDLPVERYNSVWEAMLFQL